MQGSLTSKIAHTQLTGWNYIVECMGSPSENYVSDAPIRPPNNCEGGLNLLSEDEFVDVSCKH